RISINGGHDRQITNSKTRRQGMARWNTWFRGTKKRGTKPVPQAPAGTFKTTSRAADAAECGTPFGGYVALPGETPFAMLGVYRFLRDAIPDISDAIWTWKRLCQTGWDVEYRHASSEAAARRAKRL